MELGEVKDAVCNSPLTLGQDSWRAFVIGVVAHGHRLARGGGPGPGRMVVVLRAEVRHLRQSPPSG